MTKTSLWFAKNDISKLGICSYQKTDITYLASVNYSFKANAL